MSVWPWVLLLQRKVLNIWRMRVHCRGRSTRRASYSLCCMLYFPKLKFLKDIDIFYIGIFRDFCKYQKLNIYILALSWCVFKNLLNRFVSRSVKNGVTKHVRNITAKDQTTSLPNQWHAQRMRPALESSVGITCVNVTEVMKEIPTTVVVMVRNCLSYFIRTRTSSLLGIFSQTHGFGENITGTWGSKEHAESYIWITFYAFLFWCLQK